MPQWTSDPRKSRITIRQLGSHTSGLEGKADKLPHDKLTVGKETSGNGSSRPTIRSRSLAIGRRRSSSLGRSFSTRNPGIAMLTYALTSALRNADQRDVRTLLRDRVMRPVGVPDDD